MMGRCGCHFAGKFLLAGLWLAFTPSHALEPVYFGPEFTLTHLATQKAETALKVIERMHNHLVKGQRKGAKFIYTPDEQVATTGHFLSPNGWWFRHHLEEVSLEFRMMPETPDYYRKFSVDMNDAIFASGSNEGWFPAMFRGGGHINVSTDSFFSDPLLFRNFIVDMMINHNELFMGIFGYDTNNAIPLPMMSKKVIQAVYAVIKDFDRGKYRGPYDMVRFAGDVQKALVSEIDEIFWERWNGSGYDKGRGKYHAMNFTHFKMNGEGRVELRGVRPQMSLDMWVRQIELVRARLVYLEKIREPIPIKLKVPLKKMNVEKALLEPPIDPQLAFRAFYEFVAESEQSWSDHRDYVWPPWVTAGELTKFENSTWFKRREARLPANNCEIWAQAAD